MKTRFLGPLVAQTSFGRLAQPCGADVNSPNSFPNKPQPVLHSDNALLTARTTQARNAESRKPEGPQDLTERL
jgi:hypothetical protein